MVIIVVNSVDFALLIIDFKTILIKVGYLQNHLPIEEIGCSGPMAVIFINQPSS